MKNQFRVNIAFFMIFLIITLPFYTSNVFAQQNTDENQGGSQEIPDAAQACRDQFTETSDMIDFLESDAITTMQSIADLLLAICTIANAIEGILKLLEATIGDKTCCNLPLIGRALCGIMEVINKAWDKIYFPFFRKVCCLVSCGWCSGGGGCGGIFSGYSNFVNKKLTSVDLSKFGGGETSISLNKIFNINAYQNIFFAAICLCPVAVLYKLKELKLIYRTHKCCIEKACENGQSTEACDQALDKATCMYIEGAVWQYLGGRVQELFMSAITALFKTLVFDTVLKHLTAKLTIPQCILKYWDLKNLPNLIKQIIKAWDYATHSFDEPECGELDSAFSPIPYRGRNPTLPSKSDYELDKHKSTNNYEYYTHKRNPNRYLKVFKRGDKKGDWEWGWGSEDNPKWWGGYDSSRFSYIQLGCNFDHTCDSSSGETEQTCPHDCKPESGEEWLKLDSFTLGGWGSQSKITINDDSYWGYVGGGEWWEYTTDGKKTGQTTTTGKLRNEYADELEELGLIDGGVKKGGTWGEAIGVAMYYFLQKYLGKMASNYVNEFVEEQCSSEWDQSLPPSNTPSNLNTGYGQSFIGAGDKNLTGVDCSNPLTTVTTQAAKTKRGNSFSYDVSYSITACKEAVSYSVYLFESNLAYQNLDSGNLELGKLISNTGTLNSGLDCSNICVTVSDNSVNTACFPVVTTS